MKYVVVGITAFIAASVVATAAPALDVCNYTVRMAMGFRCPIRTGETVCISVNAAIGPCQDEVRCFAGGSFFCSATLIPKSGPEAQCAFSSKRATGFKCYAPARLVATRTPTPSGEDTATFTPTDTPLPATDTPTATSPPAATATDTAMIPAATPSATATGVPTGTATATTTATATAPAATVTDTPAATATQTTTETPTGTPTGTVAATGTPTGTVAALVLRF